MVTVTGWSPLISVDWSSDGKTIFVPSVGKDGISVLLQIDEAGKVLEVFRAEKGVHIGPALQSPDGRHLALQEVAGDSNVWIAEDF
jgi:hypothetical protein